MYIIPDFSKISFIITEQNYYRTIIKRTNEVLKHRVQYFLLTNEYVLLYILYNKHIILYILYKRLSSCLGAEDITFMPINIWWIWTPLTGSMVDLLRFVLNDIYLFIFFWFMWIFIPLLKNVSNLSCIVMWACFFLPSHLKNKKKKHLQSLEILLKVVSWPWELGRGRNERTCVIIIYIIFYRHVAFLRTLS